MNVDENQYELIANALVVRGYLVLDNFLPEPLLHALQAHFNAVQENEFKAAGVGRKLDYMVQENIRSDKIHWLESNSPTTTEFLQCMDELRIGLNRRLFLGLCDYESHFAYYTVGAFYKKHLDSFREDNQLHIKNRKVSTVLYLNENWQPEQGGELLIYTEDGTQILEKILPEFGRFVIFLSEKFPHEVLPATRERKSIAGWFRVNH